jgi:type 1 fimbriae regulatory protein FimB/type 1 fimbriae regulatory protein FimE
MRTRVNGTVQKLSRPAPSRRPPPRQRNEDHRPREHLTPSEVDRLIEAAQKRGCYGQRDATAILLAYTHGLRVSELVALR